VFVHASAAPDDLLELGHRVDFSVERHNPTSLNVNAGREKARGRDQHRIFRFGVDEIAEFGLPLDITTCDTHDIAAVLRHEIGVLVDERLAHPSRVLLIYAKHNGLLKAIAALLEEVRDLARDQLGTLVQYERAVEVLNVIDAILDLFAHAVE